MVFVSKETAGETLRLSQAESSRLPTNTASGDGGENKDFPDMAREPNNHIL